MDQRQGQADGNRSKAFHADQAGTLLYATTDTFNYETIMHSSTVIGFNIASNGTLSPVPGSPFSIGNSAISTLSTLAVFPPKTCVQTVDIEIKPPASPPVSINPAARGKIPVAILSTLTFNAVTQRIKDYKCMACFGPFNSYLGFFLSSRPPTHFDPLCQSSSHVALQAG